MAGPIRPNVRCRRIEPGDVDAVVGLLHAGFPRKPRRHWTKALALLSTHATPDGYPRYGYLLEADHVAVGVLLLIFAPPRDEGGGSARCNVSSWYVDPAFGPYGWLLNLAAIKHRPVTYVNVSPAAQTWPVIEAQGFARFSNGTFAAVPGLGGPFGGVRVTRLRGGAVTDGVSPMLSRDEVRLLRDHDAYGCLTLVCVKEGIPSPFIFRRRVVGRGLLPCAQLIYSRSIEEFVRFAGPIGRFLASRGMPFVLVAANGPISGLLGTYYENRPRMYYKGPDKPVPSDLSYTEAAMFGL